MSRGQGDMRTFSCALVSLFWTLMASFPAVPPFPISAMSGGVEGSPAVQKERDAGVRRLEAGGSLKETLYSGSRPCVKPVGGATRLAARDSNPVAASQRRDA